MRRRRFLAIGLLAAVGAAFAVFRPQVLRLGRIARQRWLPAPVLDRTAPLGAPSEAELNTLRALAAHVLPSTAGQAGDAVVRRHILEQSARVRGMLTEYRRAVRLLDTAGSSAPTPFAARSASAQLATLLELFPVYTSTDRVGRLRAAVFARRGARAARTFVVADLLGAFYRSRQGWMTVGYSHFPGVGAANPLDYTRVPDAQPEQRT